jgi:hypothetical protein
MEEGAQVTTIPFAPSAARRQRAPTLTADPGLWV